MTSVVELGGPLIDLRPFKLTLPVGEPGHPTEYQLEDLQPWFDPRSISFRTPAGGVTTPNSTYPRSELRERGWWPSRIGVHKLKASLAVEHLPEVKPHVVVAQIHDGDDDVIQVRLEGRRLFVESDGDDIGTLDLNYELGSRFDLRVIADKNGLLIRYRRYVSTGQPLPWMSTYRNLGGVGWFFKAGCYLQTNTSKGDAADAYGEVRFWELRVVHHA